MRGPGAMHSKLQLLKFPEYLRIVIPTANLVPYDWGETGVMENVRSAFGYLNCICCSTNLAAAGVSH